MNGGIAVFPEGCDMTTRTMVLAVGQETRAQSLMLMGLFGAGLCDALYFLLFTLR